MKWLHFLSSADVFICTSISETFGIAIREALMCGVPVISTKNGGAEDIINYKNGFLVNLHGLCKYCKSYNTIGTKRNFF